MLNVSVLLYAKCRMEKKERNEDESQAREK